MSDRLVSELNGKMFYFGFWAVMALLIIYLFYRYYRGRAKQRCPNCGKEMYKGKRIKEVIKGMPVTFCSRVCATHYREHGPLSAGEQQVRRAEETINQSK